MKLLFTFILLSGVCFGQNKKEQLLSLNQSIDSLELVLSIARDNAAKDILNLDNEINQLKTDVSSLQKTVSKVNKESDKLKKDLAELSKKNLELESKTPTRWDIEQLVPYVNEGEPVPYKFSLIKGNVNIAKYTEELDERLCYNTIKNNGNSIEWLFNDTYYEYLIKNASINSVSVQYNMYGWDSEGVNKVKTNKWQRDYKKNSSGKWEEIKCAGDCN